MSRQEIERIKSMVDASMAQIFGNSDDAPNVDDTVHEYTPPSDGYTFKKLFSGVFKELVMERAAATAKCIDYMRSPHASSPVLYGRNWVVTVTWYSLD